MAQIENRFASKKKNPQGVYGDRKISASEYALNGPQRANQRASPTAAAIMLPVDFSVIVIGLPNTIIC
jgi:hypothetical protein